jgi:16S rRNA (cytosine1402-N4)-methyltransferase
LIDSPQTADAQPPNGHQPVMLAETLLALAPRPDGCYLDCTFGRGGHSRALLERLGPNGRLIALDRDPQAVACGAAWSDPRFSIAQARFATLGAVLDRLAVSRLDGVLLDLGVSSPQLDDATRGFSFRAEGPLDMRMDPGSGLSVRQWLIQASEQDIAKVLEEYGEERFAVPIAKAIAASVRRDGDDALASTTELARLVATVLRSRRGATVPGRDPATRTFQALRIFINQELDELSHGLAAACDRLAPAGRLAVISFHSLEDRIVKRFIAHQSGRDAPRDPVTGAVIPGQARLRVLGRWLPGESEIAANPRARSAVLRAAEKL